MWQNKPLLGSSCREKYFYRLQTKFQQASVILFQGGGGVLVSVQGGLFMGSLSRGVSVQGVSV